MAQTKPKAGQFYGVSDNGTDGQFLKTDGTGGMSWDSPITNPTITSIDYPGTQTAADPAGGESVIINGTLFASGITCTVGGISAVTAFNSATQITITTPAKAAGPYTVAVLNPDGGTASQANFIQYSGVPVWSTAAGTLGNVLEGTAASFQVTATEGSDTIEYAVTTGTLPTGLSLATATGAITGTAPAVSADTTTTFSITATDDENQTSASRSFSITVQNDAPSNHFASYIYTGNGGTQSITGLNFSPGLVWIKKRNATEDHAWFDTVRGTQQQLSSNLTSADYTTSNALSSFNSDGFTTGNNGATNNGSGTYVAWNFKAGGATVANTDGTINSQVSVNDTLGFSIVSYSGNSASSATIGHGLNAAPQLIISKALNFGAGWPTMFNDSSSAFYGLRLNDSGANNAANGLGFYNNTAPTSSLYTVGGSDEINDAYNYIAYCFTSKPGFSKVGSYTGNGSTSGPIVQTGFEIAFLMIKSTSSSNTAWNMWDNKRTPYDMLRANTNEAEFAGPGRIQFFANGFQLLDADASRNSSGGNYIYLAFAADGSTATPSLANSFATELYTGNGYPNSGTQSITGVGFKPDLTWIKARNTTAWNILVDSIRGVDKYLFSNATNADFTQNGTGFLSFDSDGFSLGADTNGDGVNRTSDGPYVAWNWKAGGTPSINTDGTITSIVSANQAAGFSIVSYTANATSGATIGHSLGGEPDMVIVKSTNLTQSWNTYIKDVTDTNAKYLMLNSTSAISNTANPRFIPGNFSSTVFSVGNDNSTNGISGTDKYIAYCFKSITGYSKVGSYIGNGSTSGPTITTGFEPSFVMIKRTDNTGNWWIVDNKRSPSNPRNNRLLANTTNSEVVYTPGNSNFLANGFQLAGTYDSTNASGGTYIYIAIKEN